MGRSFVVACMTIDYIVPEYQNFIHDEHSPFSGETSIIRPKRKRRLRKRNPRRYSDYQLSELTKTYCMNPHTKGESLKSLSKRLDISVACIRMWLFRKRRRESRAEREQGKLKLSNYFQNLPMLVCMCAPKESRL